MSTLTFLESTRAIAPSLLKLAWPVALSRLGIMGMGVADVIVVGQLAPDELADQALGWAPTAVVLVGGIGLLTGVQVLAARAMGEGKPEEAGAVWRRGIVLGAATGILVALPLIFFGEALLRVMGIAPDLAAGAASVMAILALSLPFHLVYFANTSFLEAISRPTAGTIAMWTANVINLALNLVFVPLWGADGSAWATLASRIFLAASLIFWIWSLKDAGAMGVRTRPARAQGGYIDLLRIGAAAAVSQIAEAGAFSAMTVIAGRISEEAVAVYQIVLNLLAIVFMIALGLSTATGVLVSEAIGRGARRDAVQAGWTGVGLNTIGMLFASLSIILFASGIGRAYTADMQIALAVAALTPLAALVTVPDGGQVVAAQALRARGDNWFPTFSHLLAYVVVMPSLAIWLAEMRGQGVEGLLYAIFWASVLSFSVLLGRWWVLGRQAA